MTSVERSLDRLRVRSASALRPAELVPLLPGALVFAIAAVWAWQDGGYAPTTWLPGALFLVGLLVTILVATRVRLGSRALVVSLAALTAFTAWNYATILWAQEPASAWDGANRTLLYLCVFAVVASRRWSAAAAAGLVGAYSLAVAAIMGYWVERATTGDPGSSFILGRLASPIAYPNAEAGLAIAAAWPAALLASRRGVHPVLRGIFLAAAGLLLEASLLAQSRATLGAVPVAVAVYLVAVPGRLRAAVVLVPLAAAVAASWHALSSVYLPLVNERDASAQLADARHAVAVSVVALLFAGTALGLADRAVEIPARAVRIASVAVLVAVLAAGASAGAAAVSRYGSPVTRLEDGWHSFKADRRDDYRREHLLSGLGSKRYDLWRVAALEFRRHPVGGIGSDNYAAAYIRERRTNEEPLYPHSLELRLLSQTGLVGAVLFAIFLGAAAVAWWRGRRAATDAQRAVSGACGMVFVYWAVHGSVDWFWEIPALGTAAFAALALGLRTAAPERTEAATPGRLGRILCAPRVVVTGVVLVGALAALSLVGPWVAARQMQRAAAEWPSQPQRAFDRLDLARRFNPLSEQPDVLAGVIAGRLGRVGAERAAFERAVRRNPLNWYAQFELGVADAVSGHRRAALSRLSVSARLNPTEPIIRSVRERVLRGRPIHPAAIDREFADRVAILQKQSGQTSGR